MKIKGIFFYALLLLTLAACSTPTTQPAVLTPTVTKTPTPSQTSSPTPTITPSATPTVTPTPELPVSLGTPFPFPVETIGPDNCNRVVNLANWGGGNPDVLFSPDGRYFLLGKTTGYTLYETSSMKPVFLKKVAFREFSFSIDGTILIYGDNGNINILNLSNGEIIRTIKINGWRITLSPDGQQIVSSDSYNIFFTEISSGKELQVLPIPYSSGTTFYGGSPLVFSKDGKMLAFQPSSGKVLLVYDMDAGEYYRTFYPGHLINKLEFSADGTSLVTKGSSYPTMQGPWPDFIEIWNIPSSEKLLSFETNESIESFSIGKDMVTVGLRNAKIIQWDRITGEQIRDYSLGISNDIPRTISPNGALVAIGENLSTGTGQVSINDISGKWIKDINVFQGKISKLTFSQDGSLVAVSSSDGKFKIWDVSSGNEILSLSGYFEMGYESAISQDGKKLATAGFGIRATNLGIFLWDVTTGQLLKTLDLEGASTLEFSPDGHLLATNRHPENIIKIWDVDQGKLIKEIEVSVSPEYLVFSPDGSTLAIEDQGGKIGLWDVATWDYLGSLSYGSVSYPKFSPDGELIAALFTGRNHRIEIFKRTGAKIMIFDYSESFDFSSDGKFLAVGVGDINIYDTETGLLVKKITHQDSAIRIKYTSSDKYIISISVNQIYFLNVIDVATGEVLCRQEIPISFYLGKKYPKISFDNRFLIFPSDDYVMDPIAIWGIAP